MEIEKSKTFEKTIDCLRLRADYSTGLPIFSFLYKHYIITEERTQKEDSQEEISEMRIFDLKNEEFIQGNVINQPKLVRKEWLLEIEGIKFLKESKFYVCHYKDNQFLLIGEAIYIITIDDEKDPFTITFELAYEGDIRIGNNMTFHCYEGKLYGLCISFDQQAVISYLVPHPDVKMFPLEFGIVLDMNSDDRTQWKLYELGLTENNVLPFTQHSSVLYKDKIYIFGGHSYTKELKNDLIVIDLKTLCMNSIETSDKRPSARKGNSMTEVDGKLYVFGGTSEIHNDPQPLDKELHDLWVYDIEANCWEEILVDGNRLDLSRKNHFSGTYKKDLIIWGGYFTCQDNEKDPFIDEYLCNINRFCLGLNLNQSPSDLSSPGGRSDPYSETRKLSQDYKTMDVAFNFQGIEVAAHKHVLMKSCKFFKDFFAATTTDKVRSELFNKLPASPSQFMTVLDFIYTGKLDIKMDTAIELLEMADNMSYDKLTRACEKVLLRYIEEDSMSDLWLISKMFHLKTLENKIDAIKAEYYGEKDVKKVTPKVIKKKEKENNKPRNNRGGARQKKKPVNA